MAYTIRPFDTGDAEQLAELALRAIRRIGPRAYSAEQVDTWARRQGDAATYRQRVDRGAVIFVAADSEDMPVGYALLEPDGHVDRLYCDPAHTRQGLAVQLLLAAETHANARGIKRLYSEASELARPAFERAGYDVTHRRDFVLDDVAIHNYAMEKRLD
ncbi:GNAT family N-acetyltransferase [Qipengyuania sp. CAU 1752]